MEVSQLRFNDMHALRGSISTLTTNETINEIMIEFDLSSKKKIEKLLKTGVVTRDVQDLYIDELSVKKPEDELLMKGQSPWVKTDNGYALTTQTYSPSHFSAIFQTVTTSISDHHTYHAVEITLGNFSFDFSNARTEESDDYIFYKNVGMTIYPSNNTIKILE
ncbi:MAG: hypothetical protein IJN22_07375 [Clostridia bacterium]|nr:hypothetical protein [Clostridia bacterium]